MGGIDKKEGRQGHPYSYPPVKGHLYTTEFLYKIFEKRCQHIIMGGITKYACLKLCFTYFLTAVGAIVSREGLFF